MLSGSVTLIEAFPSLSTCTLGVKFASGLKLDRTFTTIGFTGSGSGSGFVFGFDSVSFDAATFIK